MMPSLFGSQFNSLRPSPPGYLFAAQMTKANKGSYRPPSKHQALRTLAPGPKYDTALDSCGKQVKSQERTYPQCRSCHLTDDRWSWKARILKVTETPGPAPGNYNPIG